MARKGLFSPDQVADQTAQRNFARLRDAVETLAKDHDVVSSPVTTLVASGSIPPGASVVNYAGGASNTLTLPPANNLGPNIGAIVVFLNTSGSSVTLVPSRGDSINGTTSLAVGAGVLKILASDGNAKWLADV